MFSSTGKVNPKSNWTYTAIEHLFDDIKIAQVQNRIPIFFLGIARAHSSSIALSHSYRKPGTVALSQQTPVFMYFRILMPRPRPD
jgi:hypothetical protein